MNLPLALRRRRLLQGAGSLASLGSLGWAAGPSRAAIDPNAAFDAKSFPEALHALGGAPQPSSQITLDLPALAENGAVVPIVVSSALPGTLEILILVDGNPQPVAARFAIPDGTAPYVATRIKLAATCTVYAAVRTDRGLFAVARGVQVVAGGCG